MAHTNTTANPNNIRLLQDLDDVNKDPLVTNANNKQVFD